MLNVLCKLYDLVKLAGSRSAKIATKNIMERKISSEITTKMKCRIRLLSFAPLFGQGGDVINEGMLINALSKYVGSIYCFTFVSFHRIFLNKALKPAFSLSKNIKIIKLPSFPLPYIFMFVNILYHMLIGFIYIIVERTIKPNITYIRGRLIAYSLLTLKPFTSRPIVYKFDNFAADEVLPTIKQRQLKSIIGKLLWVVDNCTLHRADLLLVNSDVMKSLIVERSSIQPRKILTCPPGIAMKEIEIIKGSGTTFVKNKVRIGFIGSLAWWQGVDILAEAVAVVKEKLPNVELFIVGDGPMREKVAEICEKRKVTYIITGFVPHEKALKYLRSFDVLVLPRRKTSATESTIPIKVVEAWALGVPVIVTSHKVFKSMCKDGEDVIFVKPDPKDVAEKILLLASNRELKERLTRNGQALARNFDYDEIAKRLLNAIWQKSW